MDAFLDKLVTVSAATLPAALYWFAMAVVFACVEINSEGKYGWAEKMPTWYRTSGPAARLYGLFVGGRPLTGYHFWMFFMPLMVFHARFVTGAPFTLAAELEVLALYFAWCPVWDFLWFVLNPEYGTARFTKQNVWWHAKSPWPFGLFPADYLYGALVSIALAGGAAYLAGDAEIAIRHGALCVTFAFGTAAMVASAPWWKARRRRMLAIDHRSRAPIFHPSETRTNLDAAPESTSR